MYACLVRELHILVVFVSDNSVIHKDNVIRLDVAVDNVVLMKI